jgi:hypothetical protein
MSNKASNQLHELIKSLSSAEKRYFKLFSERHPTKEKKSYIKLFAEIDKQSEYNEAILLEKLRDSALTRHFSIAKNRLYHQLLRSLDSFHSSNSIEPELYQYLHYANILFDKTLYGQCERVLNTALKIAQKHEHWAIILLIAKRKKRLAETDNYQTDTENSIININALEQEALAKLNVESKLWLSKSVIFENLFRKGQARQPEHLIAMHAEIDKAQALLGKNNQSLESRYLLGQAQSAYGFASGDYDTTATILTDLLNMLEAQMDLVKHEPGMYISVLTNLVYVNAKLNRFDETNRYLVKAREWPNALISRMNDDLELRIFNSTYSIELAICNLTGNTVRGIKLLDELEPKLKRWEQMLSPVRRAGFYHSMCTLYFIAGDSKKALFWNNELLNSISIEKSEDLYCFAEMLHLIIHFELGNHELIPYGLKSLRRYLETRERRYKFEELFMDLFRKLSKNQSPMTLKELMAEFSDRVIILESDPYEKHVMEYFDFQAWAESKATGEEISKILLRKAPGKELF